MANSIFGSECFLLGNSQLGSDAACSGAIPTSGTYDQSIASTSDDGYHTEGYVNHDSPNLYIGDIYTEAIYVDTFLRFTNVNIPQGATITSAAITYTPVSGLDTTGYNYIIDAFDEDNSAQIVDGTDWASRPRTTAKANGGLGEVSGGVPYTTFDIAAVVQEIIDRPGWQYGNALQLVWEGDTYGGGITIYAHEDETYEPASLEIVWTNETVSINHDGEASLTGEATISASASIEIVATTSLTSEVTLDSTATIETSAVASLTSEGSFEAVGQRVVEASSNLTGQANLEALAQSNDLEAEAVLTSTATISVSGALDAVADVALESTANLAAEGTREVYAETTLDATGSIEALGALDAVATISMTSEANFEASASSTVGEQAEAVLDGNATLVASAVREAFAEAVLTAEATVAAAGDDFTYAEAVLSCSLTLDAEALRITRARSVRANTATLVATANYTPTNVATTLAGSATMVAVPFRTNYIEAALTAETTIEGTFTCALSAASALDATGALETEIETTINAQASFTSTSSMVSPADKRLFASAQFEIEGTLADAEVEIVRYATLAISSTGTMALDTPSIVRPAAATLGATASLAAVGEQYWPATLDLDSEGTLAASGTLKAAGKSALGASASLVSSGDRTQSAEALLTCKATMSSSHQKTAFGGSLLVATATIGPAAKRVQYAEATLSGSISLAARAGKINEAATDLATSASMAPIASKIQPIEAQIVTSAIVFEPSAALDAGARVNLTGESSLNPRAEGSIFASALLSGTGSITEARPWQHITSAVREYLANETELADLIGNRFYPLAVPSKARFPAIAYTLESNDHKHNLGGASGLATATIAFDIQSFTYSDKLAIAAELRDELHGLKRTQMGSVDVLSVSLASQKDDDGAVEIEGEDVWFYGRRMVFNFTYRESRPMLSLPLGLADSDIERSIYDYLRQDPSIVAIVGDRVYPSLIPQKVKINSQPVLIYSREDGPDYDNLDEASGIAEPSFSLTVISSSHKKTVETAEKVRVALQGMRGTIGESQALSILLTDEGVIEHSGDEGSNEHLFELPLTFQVSFRA